MLLCCFSPSIWLKYPYACFMAFCQYSRVSSALSFSHLSSTALWNINVITGSGKDGSDAGCFKAKKLSVTKKDGCKVVRKTQKKPSILAKTCIMCHNSRLFCGFSNRSFLYIPLNMSKIRFSKATKVLDNKRNLSAFVMTCREGTSTIWFIKRKE